MASPADSRRRTSPLRSTGVAASGVITLLMATSLAAAQPFVRGPISPMGSRLHWHLLTPATSPAARNWVAMAYDVADLEVVLYGGYDGSRSVFFNDTWTFAAGSWTQLFPASHPSATTGLVLAFDPTLHGVVAFGGQAAYGSAFYGDTWLFKAGSWTNITPTGPSPPARSQYAMVYDPNSRAMVLFGGTSPSGSDLSDTWLFNGTAWAQAHPIHSPEGRQFASLIYDPINRDALLVGGQNTTHGGLSGTWVFKNGQWTRAHGTGLAARVFLYSANLRNGTPILFGGQLIGVSSSFNSTYEFLGTAWQKVHATSAPAPRNNGGFAYDAHDRYLVLFGGRSSYGGSLGFGSYFGDTWSLT